MTPLEEYISQNKDKYSKKELSHASLEAGNSELTFQEAWEHVMEEGAPSKSESVAPKHPTKIPKKALYIAMVVIGFCLTIFAVFAGNLV